MPRNDGIITTKQIKIDLKHAKARLGLGGVIERSWLAHNRLTAEQKARRDAYLKEANDVCAGFERWRMV
jgi:hypothetical protein